MDGVLIIDKPAGITSHDVVARVRKILKTRRVGHTGTLDPFATGVMVVLVGKATRLAQFLDKDEKEYKATVRFGFETDTGDLTGTPTSEVQSSRSITGDDLNRVLPTFIGESEQTPPMYSAKKVAGKKLYEHAREGNTVDRAPQRILIRELELMNVLDDTAGVRVVCSAGTYIRTLAEDIGRVLGTGAHLADLRRTRAGRFDLSQSVTLDELADESVPDAKFLAVETAVSHLPLMRLLAARVGPTKSGLSTRVASGTFDDHEAVRMLDDDGQLIAVGIYNADEASVKPKVVLV